MSRLFDRTSIVALALIVFGCTQRPDAPAETGVGALDTGAAQLDVDRWAVSGCTTDSDCEAMEDFVTVVCANQSKEACDVVISQMFFRD